MAGSCRAFRRKMAPVMGVFRASGPRARESASGPVKYGSASSRSGEVPGYRKHKAISYQQSSQQRRAVGIIGYKSNRSIFGTKTLFISNGSKLIREIKGNIIIKLSSKIIRVVTGVRLLIQLLYITYPTMVERRVCTFSLKYDVMVRTDVLEGYGQNFDQ